MLSIGVIYLRFRWSDIPYGHVVGRVMLILSNAFVINLKLFEFIKDDITW